MSSGSYLSTVTIVKSKPYVGESKADGLEQEEVQKEGDASVGPAPVDQQQPLQEPELGQRKIGILHRLTSFHSRYSNTDVSRWGSGEEARTDVRTQVQQGQQNID